MVSGGPSSLRFAEYPLPASRFEEEQRSALPARGWSPADSSAIFDRLDEFREGFFLLLHDLLVAHQLVEPGLVSLRDNRPEQSRLLAGFNIRARHIYQHRFDARHVKGVQQLVQ